ncbi:DnaA/Hda family protein [Hyphomonas sp.]|uniref:DnaA ATPase domain-containing protein n=1 Tax=Hyphomonas sp. TaxID=87 RepID=UPI0025BA91A5|nr:DnaA/Hda family protein [Hyphomonas sp.]MBU3921955.1 AAA family ATPase [Alphaproteobacteria bacterium]
MFASRVNQGTKNGGGDDATGQRIWEDVQAVLASRMAREEFDRWIAELCLVAEVNGEFLLAAQDPVALDRVNTRHKREIERLWAGMDPQGRAIRLICWRTAPAELRELVGDPWETVADDDGVADAPAAQTGGPAMTFENLVVGPSNQIAAELAKRIAAGLPAGTPITLIYGPQGTGKTHIVLSLRADVEARDPKRKVVYLTAEEFMSAYLDGVKARDTSGLKRRLRTAAILIVDDLHRIAGKPGTENELYQNIREVTGNGGQVVLVGDAAPGETVGFGQRMRGEIKGATAVEIGLPDAAMRREILTRLASHITASHPDFQLGDDMIQKLNSGIRGPGRELTGAVWSLFTEANFGEETPTMDMLERVVRRHSGEQREPTIDVIKKATLKIFPIGKTELEGPSKMQAYVYPRQIAMYLCRTMTRKSFPQIGRAFGKRDHTTVLYAFRRIKKAVPDDVRVAEDVARVEALILDLLDSGQT